MTKKKILRNKKQFIILVLIFLFTIIGFQGAFNLIGKDLSIIKKMKEYNVSHTDIAINTSVVDTSLEVEEFLNSYQEISYYITNRYSINYPNQIELYQNNEYDIYNVIDGKTLNELGLYEVAISKSYFDYVKSVDNESIKIGDEVELYGKTFKIVSIIDYIQKSESFNELTMIESSFNYTNAIDFHRFIVSDNTFNTIASDTNKISKVYKIIFDEYSVESEKDFITDLLVEQEGNTLLKITPFYDIFNQNNGINQIVSTNIFINVSILTFFSFVVIFLSIRSDIFKEYDLIGNLKAIGISRKEIFRMYSNYYKIAFLVALLIAEIVIVSISLITNNLIFSYSILSYYLLSLFVIILMYYILLSIIKIYVMKLINIKPFDFNRLRNYSNKHKSKNRNSELNILNLTHRFLRRDKVNTFFSIVIYTMYILIINLVITLLFLSQSVYTDNNYGLDYTYKAFLSYEQYDHLNSFYEFDSLILLASEEYIFITDGSEITDFVGTTIYHYSGDLCNFIESIEIGNCRTDDLRYGVISYKLANDYNFEVSGSNEDSIDNWILYYELSLENNSVHKVKIIGINTILEEDGYVIYDFTTPEQMDSEFLRTGYKVVLIKNISDDDLSLVDKYINDNGIYYIDSDMRDRLIEDSEHILNTYFLDISIIFTILIFTTLIIIVNKEYLDFLFLHKNNLIILRNLGIKKRTVKKILFIRTMFIVLIALIISIPFTLGINYVLLNYLQDTIGVYNIPLNNFINSLLVIIIVFSHVYLIYIYKKKDYMDTE